MFSGSKFIVCLLSTVALVSLLIDARLPTGKLWNHCDNRDENPTYSAYLEIECQGFFDRDMQYGCMIRGKNKVKCETDDGQFLIMDWPIRDPFRRRTTSGFDYDE